MKNLILKSLALLAMAAFSGAASASVIRQVDPITHKLLGATGIEVFPGDFYDVVFTDHPDVYPGWNSPRVTIVVASLEPRTLGAAMKEISGTLRTIIQGPGSSSAVAA